MNRGTEEAARTTEKNHSHVDTLATLDVGHNANNSIIIRAGRGHVEPPLQRYANAPDDPADNPGKPHGEHPDWEIPNHSPARDQESRQQSDARPLDSAAASR